MSIFINHYFKECLVFSIKFNLGLSVLFFKKAKINMIIISLQYKRRQLCLESAKSES